jgi:4'-phosphopantetheinyl transferase
MTVQVTFFDLRHDHPDAFAVAPEERERAARFLREEDRHRYLMGRSAIRRLCAQHLGARPAEMQLLQNEHGKPYLAIPAGVDRLEFNLAHSGDCIALAWSVGTGASLGIDVETVARHRTPDFHGIARTAFSPAECAVLDRAGTDELAATFYQIWVRKEAVVKAEGCGIAAGNALREFTVATLDSAGCVEWPVFVNFPSGQRWQMHALPTATGYVAALATLPGSEVRVSSSRSS